MKKPNPKKVQAIVNIFKPTNPQQIQVFNGMVQFIDVLSRTLPLSWHQSQSWWGRYNVLFGPQSRPRSLGLNQAEIYGNTNSYTSKLATRIPCAHICIFIGNRCNVSTKPN